MQKEDDAWVPSLVNAIGDWLSSSKRIVEVVSGRSMQVAAFVEINAENGTIKKVFCVSAKKSN